MKFILIVLIVLSIVSRAFPLGMPGGASAVDVKDKAVVAATDFAVTQVFSGDRSISKYIVSATKQVVNGIIYGVNVEIKRPEFGCSVREFKVLERFSHGSSEGFTLLNDKSNSAPCTHL